MSTTTTGSNSNTSGNTVATVKFWPKGILPRVRDYILSIGATVTRIINGDETAADTDFSLRTGGDNIADNLMEEIARRLIVTFTQEDPGNVVFSPSEPDDHTKAWWQTDPVTGIPLGQPKRWDGDTNSWVEIAPSANYVPPQRRVGSMYAAPGSTSTVNFNFADLKTTNYSIRLTPTTFYQGSFYPAPGSFPTANGYLVVNKTNTQISVTFFGTPNVNTVESPVGITWEVDIEGNPAT